MNNPPQSNEIHLPINTLPLVSNCDYIQCREGFIHPNRIMDVNVLLYVEEGSFHLFENGIEYSLPSGSLTFLKQGLHHYGDTKCPDGTKWFFIHFFLPDNNSGTSLLPGDTYKYSEGSAPDSNNLFYVLPKQIMTKPDSDIVKKLFRFKDMYQSSSWEDHLRLNTFLYEILLEIYRNDIKKEYLTPDEERTALVKEYLAKNSDKPFNSSAIEALVGLSYKHINLIFKRNTGVTMQKYHYNLRMELGMKLLKETSHDIFEISQMLGYEESFYFSNSFKRKYGISPANYRKELCVKI